MLCIQVSELRLAISNLVSNKLLNLPGSGPQILGNGSVIIYLRRSDGMRREGVAVVLSKKMKNALISYTHVLYLQVCTVSTSTSVLL